MDRDRRRHGACLSRLRRLAKPPASRMPVGPRRAGCGPGATHRRRVQASVVHRIDRGRVWAAARRARLRSHANGERILASARACRRGRSRAGQRLRGVRRAGRPAVLDVSRGAVRAGLHGIPATRGPPGRDGLPLRGDGPSGGAGPQGARPVGVVRPTGRRARSRCHGCDRGARRLLRAVGPDRSPWSRPRPAGRRCATVATIPCSAWRDEPPSSCVGPARGAPSYRRSGIDAGWRIRRDSDRPRGWPTCEAR